MLVMKRSAMHWVYLGSNGDWLLLGGKKISHKWMAIFRTTLSGLWNKCWATMVAIFRTAINLLGNEVLGG